MYLVLQKLWISRQNQLIFFLTIFGAKIEISNINSKLFNLGILGAKFEIGKKL